MQTSKAPQHETRIMPNASDVAAIANHHKSLLVELDGWVNTCVGYPGGSTVVYKAETEAAVA